MTTADLERLLRLPPVDEVSYVPPGLRRASLAGLTTEAGRPAAGRISRLVLVGLAAIAVVIGALGALAMAAGPPPSPAPSASSPAEALGVAETAIVQTADGFVAGRITDARVELAIAQREGDHWRTRVLASFEDQPVASDATSLTVVAVSCDSSWRLLQPNFVFGVNHDASDTRPIGTVVTDTTNGRLSGHGSAYPIDGAWVVAFDARGSRPDGEYRLSVDRGHQYRIEPLAGGSFARAAPCGSERADEPVGEVSPPPPTPTPPPTTGRLVFLRHFVVYGPSSSPELAPRAVTIVNASGNGDVEFEVPLGESGTDLVPGTYRIDGTSSLNPCHLLVRIAAGATTTVDAEWGAGYCDMALAPGPDPAASP